MDTLYENSHLPVPGIRWPYVMLDGPDVLNLLNILMVLHIVSHPPKVDTQILNFHMPSSVARGRVT